jgi:UPF0755 protein
MSIEQEQYRYYEDPGRGGGWLSTVLKVLGALALVVILFGGAYLGVRWLAGAVNRALGGSDETTTTVVAGLAVEVEVPAGSSAGAIGAILADAGVINSATDFEREVRAQRVGDRLQAGTYDMETGSAIPAVIAVLLEGPGSGVYRLTVIEGLRIDQMLDSIAGQTDFTVEQLTEALLDGSVTTSLRPGRPDDLQDWEGLLFPDTYEFSTRDGPADVLQLMADTTGDRVAAVDWSYLEEQGLSVYDGLVIASLIEREAALDEERPIIASVIFNRLGIEMPLQIDATVVYVLKGMPEGGLSLADLQIDSPYNTYRYIGLPPTPISGARPASLRAAATPADTDFLYYVLAGEDGSHAFTADYDEFLLLQEQARENGLIP